MAKVKEKPAKESIVRSIRFPVDLFEALQREAERTDRNLNNLVLKMCKDALRAREQRISKQAAGGIPKTPR
jgi:hypothetical protein